jgi:hypothetical protein
MTPYSFVTVRGICSVHHTLFSYEASSQATLVQQHTKLYGNHLHLQGKNVDMGRRFLQHTANLNRILHIDIT